MRIEIEFDVLLGLDQASRQYRITKEHDRYYGNLIVRSSWTVELFSTQEIFILVSKYLKSIQRQRSA